MVIFLLALLVGIAPGQTVSSAHPVSEQEARQHLVDYIAPVYPPIAKAAHIIGDVRLTVTIESNGHVSTVKALSGPQMLFGAAMDAAKKWTFSPFEKSGIPVRTTTEITVPFELPSPGGTPNKAQLQAAQDYFPLSEKCSAELKQPEHEAALSVCKQALDKALASGEFTNSDKLNVVEAHQSLGHALLDVGKLDEAFDEETAAIDEAKKCLTDTDQEYAMPFYWRARVEAALGKVDPALTDVTIAEETHRRAIKNLPDMKAAYSRYLAIILRQHATWLEQMGRTAEADKLRSEAASL